jgi:hypothetical protein
LRIGDPRSGQQTLNAFLLGQGRALDVFFNQFFPLLGR